MSLFQCDNCGCLENTALTTGNNLSFKLGEFEGAREQNQEDKEVSQEYRKILGLQPNDFLGCYCSACSPVWFTKDGDLGRGPIPDDMKGKAKFRTQGMWHGEFERTFYPIGKMHTDADGNLAYGPPSMERMHRNSPPIEKYVLGYGNDFDWRKANSL